MLLSYILLPSEITAFERAYLKRMNRIGLVFFYLHIPVFMAIAAACGTGPLKAMAMVIGLLIGPTIAYKTFANERAMSGVFGFTAMCMGGLLVHFGQGPMQIEMHFYFFVLLALLAVFANPLAIVIAAVTVAVHHLLLFLLLPSSVFNYDASIWAVVVHATFVVLESIAACFVARSFFDNVIGLEKIVGRRTAELDARNEDMRRVLHNVGQGFVSLGREGVMSAERSAVLGDWLGDAVEGETFWSYLERRNPEGAAWFQLAFDSMVDGFLPIELSIDQMPKRMTVAGRALSFEYRTILVDGAVTQLLLVISDVSALVESERMEADQRETLAVFGHVVRDRAGFQEFISEGKAIVERVLTSTSRDETARLVHTLKGNAGLFGARTLAEQCHQLENEMVAEEIAPSSREHLRSVWMRLTEKTDLLIGGSQRPRIELDEIEHKAILDAVVRPAPREELARMIRGWKLEPTALRLARVAEQSLQLATRANKPMDVQVTSNQLRLEATEWAPFWSSFVHLVRNAVDHGIETPAERAAAGKNAVGLVALSTFVDGYDFVVEIKDDGRGIDWAALAEKSGLAEPTHDDLVALLCKDGYTTRTEVTELSGRGVGMGAVVLSCEERGGFLRIESEPGKGTTLQCRFPAQAMMSNPLETLSLAGRGRASVIPVN